eukprot:jgi/Picsp_1/6656/NSC_03999-R1_phenazine biosynthesis protein family
MEYYVVDAFTKKPFGGNPAAIVVCPGCLPTDSLMQKIAREINLSETAFLLKVDEGHYNIRYWTPSSEVDLCGHATLAASHLLYELGIIVPDQGEIVFDAKGGRLKASRTQGDDGSICMVFPSHEPVECDVDRAVIDGLSINVEQVMFFGKSSQNDYFVVFRTEQEVASIQPNFSILATAPCRGIITTSARRATRDFRNSDDHNDSIDFVSRFFGPAVGILEDPVTGSAHCTLGPYWSRVLQKSTVIGKQLSERAGIVAVQCRPSLPLHREKEASCKQVEILGNAILISKSVFLCEMD